MGVDPLGLDVDAAGRWIDDWQASIEDRVAQTRALSAHLSTVKATARSADGLVTATVNSSGALVELRLDDGIRAQPAARTAGLILATVRAAQTQLAARVREAVANTVGLDSSTGQMALQSLAKQLAGLDRDGEPGR